MSDDEDEIEFLRTMPPRPKLLPVPLWHGGSEIPTREAFGDDYEDAMLNYHKHIAINEHNARLLQAHDAAVEKHIRDTARRDVERRYADDPKAGRIADIQAKLADVNAQLAAAPGDGDATEFRPLTDAEMERLRGMTRLPENAGSLSTQDYAAARERTIKAQTLLEMEKQLISDTKRKATPPVSSKSLEDMTAEEYAAYRGR